MGVFIRERQRLAAAVAFYTRIRVPQNWLPAAPAGVPTADLLPVIGLIIGVLTAAVQALAGRFLPLDLAAICAVTAGCWLTGAFHEDGLADMIDGLGGAWQRDDALRIMKDSQIGTFGVLALVLILMTKVIALSHLPGDAAPLALIYAHAGSRALPLVLMHLQGYARTDGKAKVAVTNVGQKRLVFGVGLGLLPLATLPRLALATLPLLLILGWYLHRLWRRRLGGYTGDCLGASQQLAEVCIYVILVIAYR